MSPVTEGDAHPDRDDEEAAMYVRELMTQPAQTCLTTSPIEKACRRLQNSGCGSLIVVDSSGRLSGIVTDRDLALAAGHLDPVSFTVGDVMSREPFACRCDDTIDAALVQMARHKVRRLPVLDRSDEVVGVLSIADVTLWGVGNGGVSLEQLVATWRCLCSAERALLDVTVQV